MLRYLSRFASFSYNARVFLIFTLFANVAVTAYMLLFGLYLDSLGYERDAIGRILALPFLAMLIAALPAARLSDRIGRKPLLVVGAAGASAAFLGLALSESPLPIGVFTFFGGMSTGLAWVVGGPYMVENSTAEERVYLFSANFALIMGSGVVGGLAGGAVPQAASAILGIAPDATLALRCGMLVPAVTQAVALIAISRARPYELRFEEGARPGDWRSSSALMGKLIAPHLVLAFGAGAMVGFLNLFFAKQFGLEPGTIGVLFAIQSVAAMAATLLGPRLADRYGRVRAVVLTQSLSIPFLAVVAYVPMFWPVVISFWMRAALMNMAEPIYNTFALEQVPDGLKATLSSLYSMTWNLGWVAGPWVSGELQTIGGFRMAFSVTLVCYIVSVALTAGCFWNAEKVTAQPGG